MKLRIGTRGSDLALWQTRWVSAQLRQKHPNLEIEEIIIKTYGDQMPERTMDKDWPIGAFVSALENALLNHEVDIAVHSHKDLQTAQTDGLTIAAIPPRGPVHDVLIMREVDHFYQLPAGARIGTNSPRRGAQLKRLMDCETVPLRGNVPRRIQKLDELKLDAIILAAAGVSRLGIQHAHMQSLDVEQMLPAPAQGALAVQTRIGDQASEIIQAIDDKKSRWEVTAERSFLAGINAGCHTPAAALARLEGEKIKLHARLYSDDWNHFVESKTEDLDPISAGRKLAEHLLKELG